MVITLQNSLRRNSYDCRYMMSFIKRDILVFGIGVFAFIILTLWLIFRNLKWVIMPLLGCTTSCDNNDWIVRFNWLESHSYIIKFYRIDVNFKYGDEHSLIRQVSTIKKRTTKPR